jgi:hypothetical protein
VKCLVFAKPGQLPLGVPTGILFDAFDRLIDGDFVV